MTSTRHGDMIREVMTKNNMTEEGLLEGCQQILDAKAKANKEERDTWVSGMRNARAEEKEKVVIRHSGLMAEKRA